MGIVFIKKKKEFVWKTEEVCNLKKEVKCIIELIGMDRVGLSNYESQTHIDSQLYKIFLRLMTVNNIMIFCYKLYRKSHINTKTF